jgi:sugar lactone lactonase YvrE
MQLVDQRGLTVSLLLNLAVTGVLVAAVARAEIGDLSADSALGQASFTSSTAQAIAAGTFGKPTGIATDPIRNRVYVADGANHRVLGWSNASSLPNGAPADLVIGQPDFVSWGCNHSVTGGNQHATLDSVCGPSGLAVDGDGNLYVADSGNCRVLEFDDPFANDATADRVLGQADGSCNGTMVTASRLFTPTAVAVDAAGNVYVADGSCRVLEFDGPLSATDAVADRVYGQPNFTTGTCGGGGLYFPQSVSLDPSGNLYIGSYARMYEFDNPLAGAAARPQPDHTLGTDNCNAGGESATTTCFPTGVANDSGGRLYLADALNSRVLEFDSPLTLNQPALVFGQPSFSAPPGGTTFCGNEACNVGGPSPSSLCTGRYSGTEASCSLNFAAAVAVDGDDNLWVTDGFNNRVLRYDNPRGSDRAADLVLGQPSMDATQAPVFPLDGPSIALSEWNFLALAIDTNDSRVAVYPNFGKYSYNTPVAILGQPDTATTGCNSTGVSAHSLCNPTAALVYEDYLWIADTGNNRVLRFSPGWLTYDYSNQQYLQHRDADFVFGQPDFTSTACRAGNDGVCAPSGLAIDAHGNLYVSDGGNNRILVDQNPLTADTHAEAVHGQPDFDSTRCAGGAAGLCDPRGIAVRSHVDGFGVDQGDDLYIADRGNNRVVLHRNVASQSSGAAADAVFGQGGDLEASNCGQGATGLCQPTGVSLDRRGNLLVADTDNNRVLEFDDPLSDAAADRVFGQATFDDTACNAGGNSPTAESLCRPTTVVASGAYEGNVFVADTANNRILRYEAPYCIESFFLTAANAHGGGVRSQPTRTRLKITRGPGAADDSMTFSDRVILLENDGAIYDNDPPLFTLATDASLASVVFKETVPDWISNIRVTNNGSKWTTGDLELSHGITRYDLDEQFIIPPGLSTAPQRDRVGYKALAVGEDLSGFSAAQAWFRSQFGSVCFTTQLKCRTSANGSTVCKAAH